MKMQKPWRIQMRAAVLVVVFLSFYEYKHTHISHLKLDSMWATKCNTHRHSPLQQDSNGRNGLFFTSNKYSFSSFLLNVENCWALNFDWIEQTKIGSKRLAYKYFFEWSFVHLKIQTFHRPSAEQLQQCCSFCSFAKMTTIIVCAKKEINYGRE